MLIGFLVYPVIVGVVVYVKNCLDVHFVKMLGRFCKKYITKTVGKYS